MLAPLQVYCTGIGAPSANAGLVIVNGPAGGACGRDRPTVVTVGASGADIRVSPWPLQPAHDVKVRQTLASADGLPQLEGDPLVHYSEGVDVDFFAPTIV